MRVLRTFFWAALLAAGFIYITGVTNWDVGRALRPVRSAGRMWSEPATAASAGFSTDEQNNIDIYKSTRDATVCITSTVYTRTFFGVYPETGTGTGFVISPDGEILTNNHVAGGGAQLTVTLSDKKVYKARVLGYDSRNDLALMQTGKGDWAPMGGGIIDWEGQFKALKRDGYHFAVSLETHWEGGGSKEESSRKSWAGMKKLLQQADAL